VESVIDLDTNASVAAWGASRDGRLIWQIWDDDEPVVFHTASAATHVLTPPAAAVLRELQTSDLSIDDITQCVADLVGCAPDESIATQVGQLLEDFDRLGLIEPVG